MSAHACGETSDLAISLYRYPGVGAEDGSVARASADRSMTTRSPIIVWVCVGSFVRSFVRFVRSFGSFVCSFYGRLRSAVQCSAVDDAPEDGNMIPQSR